MKSGICSKCDSANVLGRIALMDTLTKNSGLPQPGIWLGVQKAPAAVLLKQMISTQVHAWVCEDCGYTEFYADKPERLGKAIDAADVPSYAINNTPFRVTAISDSA